MRRSILLAMAVSTGVVLTPLPAIASITEGGASCGGSAVIEGKTYTPANDTPGNAIPIPDKTGVKIPWTGRADFDNSSHSGALFVNVAGFNIQVDSWSGGGVETESSGVYELDSFYEELDARVPIGRVPGVWRVSGRHTATDGVCAGFAMIRIEGNPLGTLVGWIVIIGLIVTASGMVYAMRMRLEVRRKS